MGWGAVKKLTESTTVTNDAQRGDGSLFKLWDFLKEAGLEGKQVDVDATLKAAGVTEEKQRNLSWDVYKAAKQVNAIDNGASPTTYESYGNELKKNTASIEDAPTREYVDKLDKELRSRVALNDQSTYTTTSQKNEGATSAEFDAALNKIASGGELPKWEDVEKVSNAQVAALEKRGVPKGNREAIRDILNNAYAMRANADNPEKFAEHQKKYLEALNYRGEDNTGKDKNKGLSWTVSPTELRQFRSALKSIEEKQPAPKSDKQDDATLKNQVDDQIKRTRTETEQRRQGRTLPKKQPQRSKVAPKRRTPVQQQQPKPYKTGVADVRRLDDAEMTALNAEQERNRLQSGEGSKIEPDINKRMKRIDELDERARQARLRAMKIREELQRNKAAGM